MIPFDRIPGDQIALMFENQKITYAALQQVALASKSQLDQFTEPIIFIPMTPTPVTVVKVVACLLAQKIFVPLPAKDAAIHARQLKSQFASAVLWSTAIQHFKTPQLKQLWPKETLFIGFTSGTTGDPKGFVRNRASWQASFENLASIPEFAPKPYVTCFTPLHYSLGLYVLLQTLFQGKTFLLNMRDLNDPLWTATILEQSQIFSVPTVFMASLQHLKTPKPTKFEIILSGETITATQRQYFEKRCPKAKLFTFYGASETSFIAYNTQKQPPAQSVGRLFPKVQLQVTADNALLVKSPMNFQGYLKNGQFQPAATWLQTGDVGRYQQGQLYYDGRQDDRINRKGEKIFPKFVETLLLELPQVKDSLVYGLTDAQLGQRVVAAVVWQDDPLSKQALNTFLKQHSYRRYQIDTLLTLDKMTYSTSGKKIKPQAVTKK